MEFWKKTKKKKTKALGTLEKNHEEKTTTLKFQPRRKRSQPWNHTHEEEDHHFGSFGKNHEKEEDRTHGSFGKN
jgi:hypothetical protein